MKPKKTLRSHTVWIALGAGLLIALALAPSSTEKRSVPARPDEHYASKAREMFQLISLILQQFYLDGYELRNSTKLVPQDMPDLVDTLQRQLGEVSLCRSRQAGEDPNRHRIGGCRAAVCEVAALEIAGWFLPVHKSNPPIAVHPYVCENEKIGLLVLSHRCLKIYHDIFAGNSTSADPIELRTSTLIKKHSSILESLDKVCVEFAGVKLPN